jgi:glycosyltransferase involved in cell wall biosynthesis
MGNNMKITVVMTTINNPANLEKILVSMSKDDHLVIAGDRKTPKIRVYDDRVSYLDIGKQVDMTVNPIGVPFDSIQRRNMAYLYAIKYLCQDAIITVDDDNFMEPNWVQEHKEAVLETKGEFCNPCNLLNIFLSNNCDFHDDCYNIVHRGVTFSQHYKYQGINFYSNKANVGVNAGMWTGDPDINAYDRVLHPNITSARKHGADSIMVDPKKWMTPFNSQNTIIIDKLFPALFLIPMYVNIYDHTIGRYDDIWQSYICQKIMAHHNLHVRFGTPFVHQNRNEHNLDRDIKEEFIGITSTDKLIEFLDEIELYGDSVLENMYEITDFLLRSDNIVFKHIGDKTSWWLNELKNRSV